jgi:iron(III) transport system substrate-binding protein
MAGGVASGALAQDALQVLHEAARKEGKVVYWGSPESQTARVLTDAFKRRFPGIEVEIFKIQSAAAIERIIAGAQSGRAEADLVDSILGYLPSLFDRSLVVSTPWAERYGVDPTRVLFDGRALTLWHLDSPIAINTGIPGASEVKRWEDVLDPRWRGKLIVEARGFPFAILAAKWGEAEAFDFLRRVVAQKPIITKGGTATLEALAGGQGALAIGAYAGTVEQYKRNGAPVDWLRVGPVPAAYAVLMQLSNAPHPNAARLFSWFMTTKEAHDANYEGLGLDLVFGRDVGELGRKYVEAKLEIVPESSDIANMQRLLAKANEMIASFQ